ncbi:uroporphyrinogen-III synthase [Catenovulum sp. SM1970]|uniref:uroporphyrinogen-III synthase n=1 Tax=Marinifaba aquimaris TaxID=2741323 RepID=UPI0015729C46|nr:uroporphyrinogen-III synthase [Marinifaba aquimaris]NTS76757.1 uroporphyrinogen-III synthase [Marinifaba aquimaris]
MAITSKANTTMLSILNPRQGERALALTELLKAHQFAPFSCPLFNIEPSDSFESLSTKQPELAAQTLIFTSVYAVQFLSQISSFEKVLRSGACTVIAIGQATQQALYQQGVAKVFTPEQATSEGILSLLAEQRQLTKTSRFAILKGEQGRTTLAKELTNLGYCVETYSLYRRCWLKLTSNQLKQIASLDIWWLTSGEMLKHLVTSLTQQAIEIDKNKPLLVPSNRIAQQAIQLGFHHVTSCENATNQALIDALKDKF